MKCRPDNATITIFLLRETEHAGFEKFENRRKEKVLRQIDSEINFQSGSSADNYNKG